MHPLSKSHWRCRVVFGWLIRWWWRWLWGAWIIGKEVVLTIATTPWNAALILFVPDINDCDGLILVMSWMTNSGLLLLFIYLGRTGSRLILPAYFRFPSTHIFRSSMSGREDQISSWPSISKHDMLRWWLQSPSCLACFRRLAWISVWSLPPWSPFPLSRLASNRKLCFFFFFAMNSHLF